MTDTTENRLYRIIRRKDLTAFVGLKKSTINNLIDAGEFPAPIKLTNGGRAVGWLETDLVRWQQQRLAASKEVVSR